MSIRLTLFGLLFLSVLVATIPVTPLQAAHTTDLIVKVANPQTITMVTRAIRAQRSEPLGGQTYLIRLPAGMPSELALAHIRSLNGVIYAVPDYERTISRTSNDPLRDQQWALGTIAAYDAWDITTGGPVVIAVIDTGVDANHPELAGRVLGGFNAITGSSNSGDDNGHGTAVAGIIAASGDNGEGIAGLCWGCVILPIKACLRNGRCRDSSVISAIRWATDNGARIINLSLGGSSPSPALQEAVRYANERGVLIVAASGNERAEGNTPNYPAAYAEALAVGATGYSDEVTGFSNTGDFIDLVAPGIDIATTIPGNGYALATGTSFASPFVSGAAALIMTLRPDLSNSDVRCVLAISADDRGAPGRDSEYGYGRLNVLTALQTATTYGGCPLGTPVGGSAVSFDPFARVDAPTDGRIYFPETGHTLGGGFRVYWEQNGGLPIFGFPISEEFTEISSDGRPVTVQYFERHRFEWRPENAPPYNVLLSRIGDDILRRQGRDWMTFEQSGPISGCRYFAETNQSVCEPFLSYWQRNGLEFDGRPGKSYAESLALFGLPLSTPRVEETQPGTIVIVQWFERARFELHPDGQVLLGLLGNELLGR
ncbi:S8 family peptidase [Chloroflexus sp. MS-CIW-1]|uniref:S8 family peptidase n=1 Tax=Chloroflexus sp. MS-CIW-1 TaxID=3055768 RepID=UPI002649E113|nr:S8 family peptidase [Chloroflexus sp. MS-CIW-1]MDN5272252.1 S8 family peptidase [Chloroflexus sp. MS-CIW-1]